MINHDIANSYLPLLLLIGIAFALGGLMVLLPYITAQRNVYKAKNAQYECGFKGFGSTRKKFDVKFYLIAILFLVFDIEIAFLFPWAIIAKNLGVTGFISVMTFLLVLTIGFIYEWKKGALDI
jgi:NADH-quinone oxidoreductase subunit A